MPSCFHDRMLTAQQLKFHYDTKMQYSFFSIIDLYSVFVSGVAPTIKSSYKSSPSQFFLR